LVNQDNKNGTIHVASEKLDLQSHNRLTDPDHGKHAGEDKRRLIVMSTHREKHAQKQAENQRAPANNNQSTTLFLFFFLLQLTKGPNPSDPHSSHPATQHRHQASAQQGRATHYCQTQSLLHLSQQHQYRLRGA
jgi:hypothetical protein